MVIFEEDEEEVAEDDEAAFGLLLLPSERNRIFVESLSRSIGVPSVFL
jgi:hypothetical protein